MQSKCCVSPCEGLATFPGWYYKEELMKNNLINLKLIKKNTSTFIFY